VNDPKNPKFILGTDIHLSLDPCKALKSFQALMQKIEGSASNNQEV